MINKSIAKSIATALFVLIVSSVATKFLLNSESKVFDPSVQNTSTQAFSQPLTTLSKEQDRSFILGRNLFHGVANDNRSLEEKGIGPLYNAVSCGSCHVRDGRGDPIASPSKLVKLYNSKSKNGSDPKYGIQIQDKSTFGTIREAKVTFRPDGKVRISELAYGNLNSVPYVRIAPQVFGVGLIEAIPDSFFRNKADPNDLNSDGISGRIPYLKSSKNEKPKIARFGWKSTEINIKDQSLLAAFEDMGLLNSQHSQQVCSASRLCVDKKELTTEQETSIISYTRSLAPPRSRPLGKKSSRGKKIFDSIGCASCHTPEIELEKSDLVVMDNTIIKPFSDFLLHDMGDKLQDGSSIEGRAANEFRTAPLWGIGLLEKVNGSLNLMHDGRAQSFEDAIELHDGESKKSSRSYMNLSRSDKEALISYLRSL